MIMYFDLLLIAFFGLIWLGSVMFLRTKKKSVIYLLFFTIFFVYLFKVLDYTLFQFQSLLLLQYFMPNLMLRGQEAGETLNLIPLIALTAEDIKTSVLNILMLIPFGFGLPFITDFSMKKVIIAGAFFSISIELIQLITGILSGVSFRVADINDLIFNTLGVVIGYVLFKVFVYLILKFLQKEQISKNPILRYITEHR